MKPGMPKLRNRWTSQFAAGQLNTIMHGLLFSLLYLSDMQREKKVASRIFQQLRSDNIPLNMMRTVICDGPNVNKTIMQELERLIKEIYPEFRLGYLRSCVLHIVHNAFGKG